MDDKGIKGTFIGKTGQGAAVSEDGVMVGVDLNEDGSITEQTDEVTVTASKSDDTQNGGMQYAGFGGYKDGLNMAAYLSSTSTAANEIYRGYEFSKAYNADPRRALNRSFPGRFKGVSTNTLNKLADYRAAKAVAKGFSKPLLGVGITLTAVDIYQNDFSASSIAWGAADTGIAIAAIAVSGPAAPIVAVGAAVYFTGRLAYSVYEAYNEGN